MKTIHFCLVSVTLSTILLESWAGKNSSFPFSETSSFEQETPSQRKVEQSQFSISKSLPTPPLPPDLPMSSLIASSIDNVPSNMRDFHRRVLEHIQATPPDNDSQKLLQSSPKYMINLYNHKVGLNNQMNGKQRNALRRSDVVRSFEAIESYKQSNKWILVFDTSELMRERIRLAEIQVTMFKYYDDVTSIEIWDKRKTSSDKGMALEKSKIGTINFAGSGLQDTQRITQDITRVLRRWSNNKGKDTITLNKQPEATEEFVSESQIFTLEPVRLDPSSSTSLESNLLFVYSTSKNIGLTDVAMARQNRNRRSSRRSQMNRKIAHKGRHSKRRHRKRNKTEKLSAELYKTRHNNVEKNLQYTGHTAIMTNEIEFDKPNLVKKESEETDETERWRQEQTSEVIIVEDKVEEKEIVVVPTQLASASPPTVQYPTFKSDYCRRVDYTIDYEKIGWGDWIVFPKRFNAYRCEGSCNVPLRGKGNPSSHARMQSLLSFHDSNIPQPCCVPSKLKPLSILYYENGFVKQREHEDMVVAECVCS